VPGVGWARPLWGDHIFLTTPSIRAKRPAALKSIRRRSRAYHGGASMGRLRFRLQTGKLRWGGRWHEPYPQAKHMKNSYASETRPRMRACLYLFRRRRSLRVRHEWEGDLVQADEADEDASDWGPAASPVVYKGECTSSTTTRAVVSRRLRRHDRNTSVAIDRARRQQLVTPFGLGERPPHRNRDDGSRKLRSYDLSGKLLWEMAGLSSLQIPTPSRATDCYSSIPDFAPDSNRGLCHSPGRVRDISLNRGNEQPVHCLATSDPRLLQPVVNRRRDYYYSCTIRRSSRATMRGPERRSTDGSASAPGPRFSGAVAYNGKIFAMSEDGDTFVIQPGPEFKVVGKNSLDDMTLATPAVANGSLIVRTASKLYRISKARPQ